MFVRKETVRDPLLGKISQLSEAINLVQEYLELPLHFVLLIFNHKIKHA